MYFQREFGIDVKGIFAMPWRRFRLLINDALQRASDDDDGVYPPMSALAADPDWNAELDRSLGKEPPRNRHVMTLEEYLN